jgi:hypothetical protein
VAIIDRDDANHDRCIEAMGQLPPSPLLTTWPCLTEAMYLLWRAGGFSAQDELWGLLADGLVILHTPSDKEWERTGILMKQYADTPMDLADASLVVAAEVLGIRQIFTLDSDFYAYRITAKTTLRSFHNRCTPYRPNNGSPLTRGIRSAMA